MPDEPKKKPNPRVHETDPAAFKFEKPANEKSPAESSKGKHKTPADFDRAHPPKGRES